MTKQTEYIPGAWNAVCSMCGNTFKNFELRKHWEGQWRCARCWEPRHPQDYVRPPPVEKPPPWVQTDATHPIVTVCTPNGVSAVPGTAIPGCMTPGYLHPFFDIAVDI